jgi:calcineurin-like phosphoesterase family protein
MTLWFISDTHFGHANLLKFMHNETGLPLRNFDSVEEMDALIIDNWNAKVRPNDHIYHLGDVAMHKQAFNRVMPLLSGKKRLVRGNHDIFKTRHYMKFFEEIHGTRRFANLVFSHIPLHPMSIGARVAANIHGHCHGQHSPKGKYLDISCELTGYSPVSLDELVERAKGLEGVRVESLAQSSASPPLLSMVLG